MIEVVEIATLDQSSTVNAKTPVTLTIAGSDSGAGAGIQADLKTIHALGAYGVSAITAITAQNTLGVKAIHCPPQANMTEQLDAIFEDFFVTSIKIGMLPNPSIIQAVVRALDVWALQYRGFVVYDPVMVSSKGQLLMDSSCMALLRDELLPRVDLITPNLSECAAMLGQPEPIDIEEMIKAGETFISRGLSAVLVKGGHLKVGVSPDILNCQAGVYEFSTPRVSVNNQHGTGCTLSSAIAARRCLGDDLPQAVKNAKQYVYQALLAADEVVLGSGCGALNHFFFMSGQEAMDCPSKEISMKKLHNTSM